MEKFLKIQGLSKIDILKLKSTLPNVDLVITKDQFLDYAQNDVPLTEIVLVATPLVLGALGLILRPKQHKRGKLIISVFSKSGENEVQHLKIDYTFDESQIDSNDKALKEISSLISGQGAANKQHG